uniref:Uncharacterized protein n=1 Tax=Panagrolaimus superbus TaxID=310955 RepID=A0A914YW51_9BILA
MNAAAKLISSTLIKQQHPSHLLLRSAKTLKKSLEIEWTDGLKAEFPYCWLRDISTKRPALVHLDVNTRPEHVEVQQSQESINVLWPSFVNLSYSSTFLRDNAIHNPSTSSSPTDHSNEDILQHPISASEQILQGKLFLSTHQTSIAPSLIMGQCEWNSSAQEPGTLWPHYETIPSVCVVDALSTSSTMIPAELTLIDTFEVLTKMSKEHPKEFEFLQKCKLEYSDGGGLFRALHPIYDLNSAGTQILSATFNNTSRSSAITTPCLETLYISLQKFGRVSAECSKTLTLFPGRRLIVNNSRAMLGCPAQAYRRLLLRFLN